MLDDLLDTVVAYHGATDNCFVLDEIAYEAIEDESDGYRSMLDKVAIVTDVDKIKSLIVSSTPIAYVRVVGIEEPDGLQGYELQDAIIQHVWGRIGTNRHDDYYPSFCANFYPLDTGARLHEMRDGSGAIGMTQYQRLVREYPTGKTSWVKKDDVTLPGGGAPEYASNKAYGSW
jgi:hypothetical protein